MKLKAVKCLSCNQIIYSRSIHDFHYCECKGVAIDGGQKDYIKIIGDPSLWELGKINLDITLKEAYKDWEWNENKLGVLNSEDEGYDTFKEVLTAYENPTKSKEIG